MALNPMDEFLSTIQKVFDDVNFHPTPLAIFTTFLALALPFFSLYILALSQQEPPPTPPQGCRKLNLQGPSNLRDQFSKKYSKGSTQSSISNPWRVKALFIYPIKSCAAVELASSEAGPKGLKYDRQFTLAQQVTGLPTLEGKVQSKWTFITQRTFPRMAKVELEMWVPDSQAIGYSDKEEWVKSQGCMVVRFPFTPDTDFSMVGLKNYGKILAARLSGKSEPMVEFRIPFLPTKERRSVNRYRSEKLKIWDDEITALNMGCDIPQETLAQLQYTLGVANPLTLFRIDGEKYREVYGNAPKKEDVGFQTSIAMHDSYPLSIMNLAAIHDVSSRLPRAYGPLTALRYRPNILFTGPQAFTEEAWTRIRIGSLDLHVSCRTTRCKLPNVDPVTGTADRNEPGTTMRKYRVVDKGSKSACLGMQCTPLAGAGVNVGDEIVVLETGDHLFF